MNKHIIFSYALISMGVLHAQKDISHQQTNCQKPSKEDLQNNIPGYLALIKDKININVTTNKIEELLDDFLNHKPYNNPITGKQVPSSLIAPIKSSTSTTPHKKYPPQIDRKGTDDIPEKVNTDPAQSNAQEESNINPMNVKRSATITKCRINEDDRNYNHHKRLLLDIQSRNIRIADKEREKTRLNKELNKLLEGRIDKKCKYECEQLEISIQYCDTYIDDYKKDITRLIEEINSLCDEDEDDELY